MTDTEPLAQFQEWYDKQSFGPAETPYTIARAAFYGGYAGRPRTPLAPSRDVLDNAPHPLRHDGPVPMARPYPGHPGYGDRRREQMRQAYLPAPEPTITTTVTPDYVRQGSPTGRLPLTGHPTGPQRRITRDDTAVFTPAKDFEYSAPDPQVLKRVHNQLTDRLHDVGEMIQTGLKHVTTVWDGSETADPDETAQFGAPSRVHTAYELSERENG